MPLTLEEQELSISVQEPILEILEVDENSLILTIRQVESTTIIREEVTKVIESNVGLMGPPGPQGPQGPAGSGGGFSVTNPLLIKRTHVDLAAGSSINLDSSALPNTIVGRLLRVTVSSSVACKWELMKRDGLVETTVDVFFTGGLTGHPTEQWETPHEEFVELTGTAGGDENFRVEATNLDDSRAADVHCTFYWDEV